MSGTNCLFFRVSSNFCLMNKKNSEVKFKKKSVKTLHSKVKAGTNCHTPSYFLMLRGIRLKVGNLFQLSTTLSLDPVSSSPPLTNWLHNDMSMVSFTLKVATKSWILYQLALSYIFEEFSLQL